MLIVDKNKGAYCRDASAKEIRAATSPLAMRILGMLAKGPAHAAAVAKQLGEHEQKVYYHVRKLRRAGIVGVHHIDDTRGGVARVLTLQAPALALLLRPLEPMARAQAPPEARYLAPFIDQGTLNCRIVVGSPDPHGPEAARARDVNYAVDLGVFLGSFLTNRAPPAVLLDTELRTWDQHLIIIGGPVVNRAAERINARSPIPYDRDRKAFTHKTRRFTQENVGIIAKMPNPFARNRRILYIAGRRHTGTRAAILALMQRFDEIAAADENVLVVEGQDLDSDGIIDSARIIYPPGVQRNAK